MMGECILYYHGKIVGGIYDDRLLVKRKQDLLWNVCLRRFVIFRMKEQKEMLLVEEVDNKEFLTKLFEAMCDELPLPKPRRRKEA